MNEPPEMAARVQYGDFRGSAAADEGDFEDLSSVLRLPDDQHVLGVAVLATHPLLDGNSPAPGAVFSRTHLQAWTVGHDAWKGMPGGLPGWLASAERPLPIRSYEADADDARYSSADRDALSILLRSSKRLKVVLWVDEVADAGIEAGDLNVTQAFAWDREASTWQEISDDD